MKEVESSRIKDLNRRAKKKIIIIILKKKKKKKKKNDRDIIKMYLLSVGQVFIKKHLKYFDTVKLLSNLSWR